MTVYGLVSGLALVIARPLCYVGYRSRIGSMQQFHTSICRLCYDMGALQRGPGGSWPTQNFGWVGHNAFGPTNNWPVCSLVKLV